MQSWGGDLKIADIAQQSYSLIIAAWVLNFMTKTEARYVLKKMKAGVADNGLAYVEAFSVDDPGLAKLRENSELIGKAKSHLSKGGLFVTASWKQELLSPFTDFRLAYYAEGTEWDLAHGEPHYHGFVVYLGQKDE
jgi:hypothetical protein